MVKETYTYQVEKCVEVGDLNMLRYTYREKVKGP